jgi:hypothetical protein
MERWIDYKVVRQTEEATMSLKNASEHPVWNVYDELRTARLNRKYYGCCLDRIQRFNTIIEISLAVTAPSSSVAGLWFWKAQSGEVAWQVLTVLTAVLALMKPFLRLSEKIRKYEEVLSGYRILEHDLNTLVVDIQQKGVYSAGHKAKLQEALKRKGALVAKSPQAKPSRLLVRRCQDEVEVELPHANFFIPKESIG